MEKLVLKAYKCVPRAGKQNVIKLTDGAMKALEELQRLTGYPIRQLASKMILFANEFVEIEEE